MSSIGTRSSALNPACAPLRQTTRATIAWSACRSSILLPSSIGLLEWISSPRDEMLRMHASLQPAAVRTLAGTNTLRRNSRGLSWDSPLPIARTG